jgi:hypothetical protein
MASGFLGTTFRLALFPVARVGMMYGLVAGMGEQINIYGCMALH